MDSGRSDTTSLVLAAQPSRWARTLDKAWKLGQVDLLPNPVPHDRFLEVVREEGLRLQAEEDSELEGGPYDGGHVIAARMRDGHLYFVVPVEAIPLLRDFLSPEDYRDIEQRIPKLPRTT